MKEKLIELIAPVLRCLPWGQVSSHTAGDIADNLIANGVVISNSETATKWIPVTERLPKEGEDVLVIGYWHEKFQPLLCYLSPHRKGEWFTSVAGQQVYTVSHWMPLPEPPKGE